MLRTCFVIQRFDNGIYDRRYRETFAPAIEKAGAKPIRADEVLGTRPIISKIEAGLREASIAFAEISEDNPNVFLELGYALSLNVPTVILCDKNKRKQLPFDVAHRPVLFYSAEAQSDFEKLSGELQENVRAALAEFEDRRVVPSIPPSVKYDDAGLDDLKKTCLLEFLDRDLRNPSGTSLWGVQKSVIGDGVSGRMVALATASLIEDGMLEKFDAYDDDTHEKYISFRLTEYGQREILRSYAALMRSEEEKLHRDAELNSEKLDDDLPF